eukprot:692733-Ditylum_brightwellii.AAC.1
MESPREPKIHFSWKLRTQIIGASRIHKGFPYRAVVHHSRLSVFQWATLVPDPPIAAPVFAMEHMGVTQHSSFYRRCDSCHVKGTRVFFLCAWYRLFVTKGNLYQGQQVAYQ